MAWFLDATASPGRRRRKNAGARGLASLVALGEGIGLHQLGGLVDHVVLAVQAGFADAGLAPEVMVLVDPDIAFRSALELDVGRGRRHLVDVEAARLLDRELPQ